jgi:hypothetical protein
MFETFNTIWIVIAVLLSCIPNSQPLIALLAKVAGAAQMRALKYCLREIKMSWRTRA